MANEQDGPPPRGNDDRVQAWLKNQERDPEAQADSKTLTVIPARGAPLPGHLVDVAAPTYRAPAYNAADVEKGMLTKQKQPLGEEPREFIRFK